MSIKERFWENDKINYYGMADKSNFLKNKKAFNVISKLIERSSCILDVGCGSGKIISHFYVEGKKFYGVDISKSSIEKSNNNNNNKINFIRHDFQNKLFINKKFDLIYSFYVLEHIEKPEIFLKNILNVLEKGGHLVLICPNFASLSNKSPCSNENDLKHIFRFFKYSFMTFFHKSSKKLYWNKVSPILDKPFKPDYDSVNEPNIITLKDYLISNNMEIKIVETMWFGSYSRKNIFYNTGQKLVHILAKLKVYPFYYSGPELLIVAKKIK